MFVERVLRANDTNHIAIALVVDAFSEETVVSFFEKYVTVESGLPTKNPEEWIKDTLDIAGDYVDIWYHKDTDNIVSYDGGKNYTCVVLGVDTYTRESLDYEAPNAED